MEAVSITLIGGPTALIEAGGFRLLTDPTFDGPGEYPLPHVTLKKTSKPALSADAVGEVDAVLLSHDQHADNLDHAGRTAHAFPDAVIVPVHCEGWAHFSQSRDDLEASFKALGLEARLGLLEPGVPTRIETAAE